MTWNPYYEIFTWLIIQGARKVCRQTSGGEQGHRKKQNINVNLCPKMLPFDRHFSINKI